MIIEQLIDIVNTKDDINTILKKLIELANMSIPKGTTEYDFFMEKRDSIYLVLTNEIIKHEYEYYYSQKDNDIISVTKFPEVFTNILLKYGDKRYLKKIVENSPTFDIKDSRLVKLMLKIDSPKFTMNVLGNPTKYPIGIHNRVKLIKSINNPLYTRFVINSIKDKKNMLNQNRMDFIELVASVDNERFTKKIIREHELYNLNGYYLVELIKRLKEPENIKEIIKNYRNYGLEKTSEIIELVKSVNDKDYERDIIKNPYKYGLTSDCGIILLKSMSNINSKENLEFIDYIIRHNHNYGLERRDILKILCSVTNIEYLDKVINRHIVYNVSQKNVGTLNVVNFKNKLDQNKVVSIGKYYKDKIKRTVKIPSEMTIGVEIESEGERSQLIRDFGNKFGDWNIKEEVTLANGVEMTSPIMEAGKLKTTKDIYGMCKILKDLNQVTSKRCGGHIHIGADYLTSTRSWKNLLDIWKSAENEIYTISNEKNDVPRRGIDKWAKFNAKNIQKFINQKSVKKSDFKSFKNKLADMQKDRCYGINFFNITNLRNTIEFRVPNGTINPDTWIDNINLFGGIVKAAEDIYKIQSKAEEDRTKEENNKLQTFMDLKNYELSSKDKIEKILILAIPEEDRKIYRERFKANSKLVISDKYLNKRIPLVRKIKNNEERSDI